MSRSIAGFATLLTAMAVTSVSLHAQQPGLDELTKTGTGTLTLSGSITYPESTINSVGGRLDLSGNIYSGGTYVVGGTTISGGTLDLYNASGAAASMTLSGIAGNIAESTTQPPRPLLRPIPAGPVFYIITEGAGMGDSVLTVPCTGKETVLSAVGAVGGISQVSSTKLWIARPSATAGNKGAILNIDWDAISKRGDNTTNYTLMPGDRLLFAEDPKVTEANSIANKTATIKHADNMVALTTSTVQGLNSTPAARELVRELLQKGFITDDDELKRLITDAMHVDDAGKKAGEKPAETLKPSPAKETVPRAAGKANQSVADSSHLSPAKKPIHTEDNSSAAAIAEPHELAMRPLPAYRIEPPDIIQIEMLKLLPLPPYRAAAYDVLQVRAVNPLPDQPLNGYFMVGSEGTINLGPAYGSVRVAGMTIEEVRVAVEQELSKYLKNPGVSVQSARVAGVQPVSGQYLVGPDGTVNMRHYGTVCVMGKTVDEARLAIKKQLATFLESPELSVDVIAFNSKVYYVITQGAGLGDSIRRLPVTGNETVLDAISQINGLSQVSSKNIYVVRPSAAKGDKATILPVDWDAITRRGATATNYQLNTGDRVYIAENPIVTRTNLIGVKTASLERIMGVISLTTSTVNGMKATPGANEVLKDLVRNGLITDDEQLKQIVLDAIRRKEASGKAAVKTPAKPK